MNCNADVCKLFNFTTMENGALWLWFQEILSWEEHGEAQQAERAKAPFTRNLINVYVMFARVWAAETGGGKDVGHRSGNRPSR